MQTGMLLLYGLLVPAHDHVARTAFRRWLELGKPANNPWDEDWFHGEDQAVNFVKLQLDYLRHSAPGADRQNAKFARLIVRTVLLAHQVWLRGLRKPQGTSPPMGHRHYLHALGFNLTGCWKMSMRIGEITGISDPTHRADLIRLRDEYAYYLWEEQGRKHGYDLCHCALIDWLLYLNRHARARTWINGDPATACPEAAYLATMVASFLHDPSSTEGIIDGALRAAAP